MQTKFIVVTGGSKGIGRAILHRFASEGFALITCAREEAPLQGLRAELAEKYVATLHYQTADLSQKEEVRAFADFVQQQTNRIEVLVNNAGVFWPGAVLTEPEGNLEYMLQANLLSAYHLTRALVPCMRPFGQGHIFNMCSIASLVAYPNGGSYAITKFALLGLSKVLREELKSEGLRVTSVLPGATYTASWEGVEVPPERLMPAEDIAEMVYATYALSTRSVVEELLIRPQLGDL
ncbi:MAG: SDR family oxidoreductase [Microscillaceae bacterium]